MATARLMLEARLPAPSVPGGELLRLDLRESAQPMQLRSRRLAALKERRESLAVGADGRLHAGRRSSLATGSGVKCSQFGTWLLPSHASAVGTGSSTATAGATTRQVASSWAS